MVSSISRTALAVACLSVAVRQVSAHACAWAPGMFGGNWTSTPGGEDNRPVAPLQDMSFNRWWFHGPDHLNMPPEKGDFLTLPAGGTFMAELTCDKGASSYWRHNPGGSIQSDTGNDVCPGQPTTVFHANNEADVAGCAWSIAYTSNEHELQPEDLTIFTVNHECPWKRFTHFEVPADLPACPPEGCLCGWHWIHEGDSGSAQMYLNMYRCQVTNAKGTKAIGKPVPPRECGTSAYRGITNAKGNCVQGPKQPMYWKQLERNNVETDHVLHPPIYKELWGWPNGAQNDIFTGGDVGAPAPAAPSPASSTPAPSTSTNARPVDSSTAAAAPTADAPVAESPATTSTPAAASSVGESPAAGTPAATSSVGESPAAGTPAADSPAPAGATTTPVAGSPAANTVIADSSAQAGSTTTPVAASPAGSTPIVDSPAPAGSSTATPAGTGAAAPTTTTRRCKRRRSLLERAHKRNHNVRRFARDTMIH